MPLCTDKEAAPIVLSVKILEKCNITSNRECALIYCGVHDVNFCSYCIHLNLWISEYNSLGSLHSEVSAIFILILFKYVQHSGCDKRGSERQAGDDGHGEDVK